MYWRNRIQITACPIVFVKKVILVLSSNFSQNKITVISNKVDIKTVRQPQICVMPGNDSCVIMIKI